MPLAPETVLMKRAMPVESIVMAAPVPSPTPETAPVKVVVPAPVPEAMVKSRLFPSNVLVNKILPPPLSSEIEVEPSFAGPV